MSSYKDELFMSKPHEECGVFGIYGKDLDVSRMAYYALYALQHRGQEGSGIVVSDGENLKLKKGFGLVSDVFTPDTLSNLKGNLALGHVRYSTTGSSDPHNTQPLVFEYSKGEIALAHNGQITNNVELKKLLTSEGSVFQTTTDSEIVANLIGRYHNESIEDSLAKCMSDMKGAYCLVIATKDSLLALRDPYGFHPLCFGTLGDGYVVASESCALDVIGAKFVRDILPGEIIVINENGVKTIQAVAPKRKAHCVFEYVYFARPDSTLDGFNVSNTRREFGRQLAREYKVDADVVISVPDSGTVAARGYAEESGIPFEEGLTKNRYIGRTFIQPTQDMRDLAVRLKLNPIREAIKGKRVIMVDDSLVRGTTSRNLVSLLKEVGAKEVHLCLSSPPVLHSCYYGIDTSNEKELVATTHTKEEIRKMIGADGLHYLSLEGMLGTFREDKGNFCCACFDGDYPQACSFTKDNKDE